MDTSLASSQTLATAENSSSEAALTAIIRARTTNLPTTVIPSLGSEIALAIASFKAHDYDSGELSDSMEETAEIPDNVVIFNGCPASCDEDSRNQPVDLITAVGGQAKFAILMRCVEAYSECQVNFANFRKIWRTDQDRDKLFGTLTKDPFLYESFVRSIPAKKIDLYAGSNFLIKEYSIRKTISKLTCLSIRSLL